MNTPVPITPRTGLTSLFVAGAAGIFALFGVFGGWAATSQISGAIVASGQVGVMGKPKIVQSLEGGRITELNVAEGDEVTDGQILARLDTAALQYDLAVARHGLAAALALRARLLAESVNAQKIDFDVGQQGDKSAEIKIDMADAAADQRAIFVAGKARRENDLMRSIQAAADINAQIDGVTAQIKALGRQQAYLRADLERARDLVGKGAMPLQKLTTLNQHAARLEGEIAAHQAQRSSLRNRQREIERESAHQRLRFQEDVVTRLASVTLEIQELTRAIRVGEAQLDRSAIRAPVAGVVHEVQVTTLGGVIAPGGTLLQIVPQKSGLTFDLEVDPRSIEQVHRDQVAEIVIVGADMRDAPRLAGRVRRISPKAVEDRRSGRSFFRVALDVPETELARLPLLAPLRPGIPVEAFLHTQDRTVLSYLAEPIAAHIRRGFRE